MKKTAKSRDPHRKKWIPAAVGAPAPQVLRCPNCEAEALVKRNGTMKCTRCGYTESRG